MIDFSSSLYLAMQHASMALQPWSQYTSGIPAALGSPAGADEVARRLAFLQGCERGVLGRSTLHLFWDLFGILSEQRVAILLDAGVYPIARWGAERAAARGVQVQTIPHHNLEMLTQLASKAARRGLRPVMLADGYCPGCGKAIPLLEFVEALRSFGGTMVLDDTQALSIFGSSPGPGAPYGVGGGGIMPWTNVSGPDLLAVSSLAKGFGAPVAVIAGSKLAIERFEAKSETRVHCSPPSIAVVHAAEHALDLNQHQGQWRRLRLARLVQYFRRRMSEAGLFFQGGLFPLQTLVKPASVDPAFMFDRLLTFGIKAVLHRSRDDHRECLSFIVTCFHTRAQIDCAVDRLDSLLQTAVAQRA
jgi:8-amino-7-oxononanoate synthase